MVEFQLNCFTAANSSRVFPMYSLAPINIPGLKGWVAAAGETGVRSANAVCTSVSQATSRHKTASILDWTIEPKKGTGELNWRTGELANVH